MSRRIGLAVVSLGLVTLAWAAPPIVLAGDPCYHAFDNRPAPTTGSSSQVSLGDCVFAPTVTRVTTGTAVTFRNASSQPHQISGANLSWGSHETLLQPGESVEQTFDTPGIYPYSCQLHVGMTGAIVVGDGGAADAGTGTAGSSAAEAAPAEPSSTADSGAKGVAVVAATVGVAFGLFGIAALAARRRTIEA